MILLLKTEIFVADFFDECRCFDVLFLYYGHKGLSAKIYVTAKIKKETFFFRSCSAKNFFEF